MPARLKQNFDLFDRTVLDTELKKLNEKFELDSSGAKKRKQAVRKFIETRFALTKAAEQARVSIKVDFCQIFDLKTLRQTMNEVVDGYSPLHLVYLARLVDDFREHYAFLDYHEELITKTLEANLGDFIEAGENDIADRGKLLLGKPVKKVDRLMASNAKKVDSTFLAGSRELVMRQVEHAEKQVIGKSLKMRNFRTVNYHYSAKITILVVFSRNMASLTKF